MSADEYVPDEEDVRTDYALGGARDTIGDIDYSAIPELEAEFDRFLARVRAEALRDAATNVRPGVDMNPTMHSGQDYIWWVNYLRSLDEMWRGRLRARAASIEQETKP